MTVEQQYVLSKVDNLINILSKSIDILELKLDMLLIEENWLIGHKNLKNFHTIGF